ncbi:MAG: hypothetical protein M3Z08_09270 [Chloroflexota bacterium]|nr:hypothetical protein [Chloroflexota bacterium]
MLDEALDAFNQAIRLDPNNDGAYINKASFLIEIEWEGEALAVYDQVINRHPIIATGYEDKARLLIQLERYIGGDAKLYC